LYFLLFQFDFFIFPFFVTIDCECECGIFNINSQLQSADRSWLAPPRVFLHVHRQCALCVLQQSVGTVTAKTEHKRAKIKKIKTPCKNSLQTCWWLHRTISNEIRPKRHNFRATQNYPSWQLNSHFHLSGGTKDFSCKQCWDLGTKINLKTHSKYLGFRTILTTRHGLRQEAAALVGADVRGGGRLRYFDARRTGDVAWNGLHIAPALGGAVKSKALDRAPINVFEGKRKIISLK
jgi:hypothetical protein